MMGSTYDCIGGRHNLSNLFNLKDLIMVMTYNEIFNHKKDRILKLEWVN